MNFFEKMFYKIFGIKREPTDSEKFEFAMDRMKYAFSDPAFGDVYDFQQVFLPTKFYLLGYKLIEIIRNGSFYELVDEFNSEGHCLSLSKENSTVKIYEYSNDSVIIHINIPDLSNLKKVDVDAPLCNSIFLCFDKNDASHNFYYTAERTEIFGGSNYMLCGLDSSLCHFNFGGDSKDGNPFMNDVTIDEIKIRFSAK